MSDVQPVPDNYPRVFPYLTVDGAAAAIDFYESVFDAKQRGDRMTMPDGRVGHAELTVGDSLIALADVFAEGGGTSPTDLGGSPVALSLYVEDVDAVVARAAERGATVEAEPSDQFYGDRIARVVDPFGHRWHVATHIEDVPMDEMRRRLAAMSGG